MIIIDLVGKKFNKLKVLSYSHTDGSSFWNCLCDCGNEVKINAYNLKKGKTKSCGCLRRETTTKQMTTHNLHNTSSYNIWVGIRQRCLNEKNPAYKNYGGRGITVCDKWLKFEGFYEDMGDMPSGFSLDRIDNNGNYCKENCHWATRNEQSNNTRTNVNLTFNNKTQSLTEWSKEVGIKRSTLNQRIFTYGWSIERALTEQINKLKRR